MRNGNFPSDEDLLEQLDDYEESARAPNSAPLAHYALSQYDAEKLVGLRNKSGHAPIKELSQRHKRVLALHVVGKSVAEICEETGYSYGRISQILNAEASQEFLLGLKAAYDSEIRSLLPLAIMAVREALISDSISTRLSGVDRFVKLAGYDAKPAAPDGGGNTYNTVVLTEAREKFITELKSLADVENVIDITPKIGEDKEETTT